MSRLHLATLLLAAACHSQPLGDGTASSMECNSCHGDAESAAPPRGVKGEVAPSSVEVGAHRLHLRDTPIRKAVACSDCHVVPAVVDAPGHVDGPDATVTFSSLATGAGVPAPAWNRVDARCSSVYCHGATLEGGSAPAPSWTYLVEPDPARPATEICGTCHAARPALPHPQLGPCSACHPDTVRADGAIDVERGQHVNGTIEEDAASAACGACHPIPGASGAHAAHHADMGVTPLATYGDTRAFADYPAAGVTGYLFGCGNCHPLDEAKHMDGAVEVELSAAGAPAGSLKARNAAGAAMADDGTCGSVYCHSSGQATPVFAVTPGWRSGASLGCDGCHANPPRYPSGPAGSTTANTHLVARSNTYTDPATGQTTVYTGGYGHFAWHNRTRTIYTQPTTGQHGVNEAEVADGTFGAAPMTCQACHHGTVDPAATGPSGYWWLNTTGNYVVAGQNYPTNYDCARSGCHDDQPGRAPRGNGGVLPRLHVNGARDVVFDPRTVPSSFGVPAAPLDPDYPYWVTVAAFADANALPSNASFKAAAPGGTAGTVSFRLDDASYEPASKTCSDVSCHLRQTAVQWGGTSLGTYATCFSCHSSH